MIPRADPRAVRQRLELVEGVLERAFTIPGTQRRVGVDALLGLIPGVGDVLSAGIGAWLIWEGRNLGLSRWQLARMAANIGVDTAVGAIPVAGDLFDFAFRSNTRNLKLIKRHLDRHHPAGATLEGEVRRG